MARASMMAVYTLTALLSMSVCAQSPAEKEAREWIDSGVTVPVEGIWEYPEDGARVLIKADPTQPGTFTITVLSTPDCRLNKGDMIGRLHSSIDARQFRLQQYSRKDRLNLTGLLDCVAVLSSDGESIRVKSPKLKLKVNINTLLPRFWRLLRMTVNTPADDLPVGLVKVYPGYDHNGSLRRKPRIL